MARHKGKGKKLPPKSLVNKKGQLFEPLNIVLPEVHNVIQRGKDPCFDLVVSHCGPHDEPVSMLPPGAEIPCDETPKTFEVYTRRKKRKRIGYNPYMKKKIEFLAQNLKPIPFSPKVFFDLETHKCLLTNLGLWDFLKIDFGDVFMPGLIEQFVANYSPKRPLDRATFINGYPINVSESVVASALRIPKKKKFSDALNSVVLLVSKEEASYIEELILNYMVLQDSYCQFSDEVLQIVNLVRKRKLEEVNWASLIWFMMRKEMLKGVNLRHCRYASHMQFLVYYQCPWLFSDSVEESKGMVNEGVYDDAKVGAIVENPQKEDDSMDMRTDNLSWHDDMHSVETSCQQQVGFVIMQDKTSTGFLSDEAIEPVDRKDDDGDDDDDDSSERTNQQSVLDGEDHYSDVVITENIIVPSTEHVCGSEKSVAMEREYKDMISTTCQQATDGEDVMLDVLIAEKYIAVSEQVCVSGKGDDAMELENLHRLSTKGDEQNQDVEKDADFDAQIYSVGRNQCVSEAQGVNVPIVLDSDDKREIEQPLNRIDGYEDIFSSLECVEEVEDQTGNSHQLYDENAWNEQPLNRVDGYEDIVFHNHWSLECVEDQTGNSHQLDMDMETAPQFYDENAWDEQPLNLDSCAQEVDYRCLSIFNPVPNIQPACPSYEAIIEDLQAKLNQQIQMNEHYKIENEMMKRKITRNARELHLVERVANDYKKMVKQMDKSFAEHRRRQCQQPEEYTQYAEHPDGNGKMIPVADLEKMMQDKRDQETRERILSMFNDFLRGLTGGLEGCSRKLDTLCDRVSVCGESLATLKSSISS